jgi:ribosomal protein L40E
LDQYTYKRNLISHECHFIVSVTFVLDLQLFNNVKQKIDDEASEDEFVDVEGGFYSSNEHLSEPTEHSKITSVNIICAIYKRFFNYKICLFCSNLDLPQAESCSAAKSVNSATVIMCAKCVEKFENLEDCITHMREVIAIVQR